MRHRFGLLILVLLVWIPFSHAQSSSLLAFINSSGQLVVTSADGANRWIVTNPGQTISNTLGFAWTEDGDLLFALSDNSIYLADPSTQQLSAIENDFGAYARLNGFTNRPNIEQPQGISPDGDYAFLWSQGRYGLVELGTNSSVMLPANNNQGARGSGLWADRQPIVAYWGYDDSNNSVLSVVDASTQNNVVLTGNSQIPITPIAWLPDSTLLLYRVSSGAGQIADVGCVASSCNSNPLDNGVTILPSTATNTQITDTHVYYVDGETVKGVALNCLSSNNCVETAFVIGQRVAPLTMMHVADGRMVYTSYANNPNTPTDRQLELVDLSCTPDCAPQTVLNGAVAGLLSADGNYVMLDIVNNGLNILSFSNGSLVYLSGSTGGQLGSGLNTALWQNQ